MRSLIFPTIPLLFFSFWAHSQSMAGQLAEIDPLELQSPETAHDTIASLTKIDENWLLAGYHVLKSPQKHSNSPLFTIAIERHFTSSYQDSDAYKISDEAALFGEKPGPYKHFTPSLQAIRESALFFLNDKGKEIRPFGGNNYINRGYLYDFDQDGTLDRADATSYRLKEAPNHEINVFHLQSIEENPRTLLKVIYNWHASSNSSNNHWTFECFDENDDGIPAIAFGPGNDGKLSSREFIFRWDSATERWSAGEIPENAHIRVMKEGETLKSIATTNPPSYPILKQGEKPAPPSQEPYVYQSLTDRPVTDIVKFFSGKQRRDLFDISEDSFPSIFPENFFSMPPKAAALALAEANRTPTHRDQYQLALDDHAGITPPPSGWVYYGWGSSGCYSYSSRIIAIHYGVPQPVLIAFDYNSIGVVGRNLYADQPANNVRLISLSPEEANFFAETAFWLNQIRSKARLAGRERSISSRFSTADGSGSFRLYPENGKPRQLANSTVWETTSLSDYWDADYDRTTFINFINFLFNKGIQDSLGVHWRSTRDINPHSLFTPIEERLADRLGTETRKQLTTDLTRILDMHATTPLPAKIISKLCHVAGTEALTPLLPELEKLLTTIPPATPEEKANNPNAILRDALKDAITQLQLVSDSARLKQEIITKGPNSRWALSQLLRTEPDAWAILISDKFAKADTEQKRDIFKTLSAGHPHAATEFLANLSEQEKQLLTLEIFTHQQQHAPQQIDSLIPVLLQLATDQEQEIYRRGQAMVALTKTNLSETQLTGFAEILIAELKNSQKDDFSSILDYVIHALAALPDSAQYLEQLLKNPNLPKNAFNATFDAIEVMTKQNPQREQILSDFLRTQFTESNGMMNSHFSKALFYDLRTLAPEIAAFATASPEHEDGDAANYSGGRFKSPIGQRYHIAREITALWTEKDPTTLARLWIGFIATHPRFFDPESDTETAREMAEKHLHNLSPDQRSSAISETLRQLPLPEYYDNTHLWLQAL